MGWDTFYKKVGPSIIREFFSSEMNFLHRNLNVVANTLIFHMQRYGAALEAEHPHLLYLRSGCIRKAAY